MTEASPFDKACELAQAIKQSQAFQRYLAAKQLLDRHPEYKQKVLKVRSVQMEVNRAHVLGRSFRPICSASCPSSWLKRIITLKLRNSLQARN